MNLKTIITDQYDSEGEIIGSKITYWSVYEQRWRTVYNLAAIPDRELAAMSSDEREWLLDQIKS
jgi:phage gpG-like protein